MVPKVEPISFASRRDMTAHLAAAIEWELSNILKHKDSAMLALSGGSTPADLYTELSVKESLDWRRIKAILVDERWVAPGESGSNESFVDKTLRCNAARSMELSGLWRDGVPFDQAAGVLNRDPAFSRAEIDICILGMGNDGHTASWFPHAVGLDDALSPDADPVVAIRPVESDVTGNFLERLSLSLPVIAKCKRIFLLITGEQKRTTFAQAAAGGPVAEMPVRALLKNRPDVSVCWAP